MAIRERTGRASSWQVYWNNPFTGKRECASFATRQEALKHDSLIKHRLKFDRESFRQEEIEENTEEITLEQAYLLYLREKQFNKKGLQWQMDAMRTPLKELGHMPLTEIDYNALSELLERMNKPGIKAVTVRGRFTVLRTVMRWCVNKGYLDSCRFPALPQRQYERFVPPTPEELSAMLLVAEPHIARVIILGSQCGLRVGPSELFRLTWADVDLGQLVIRVSGAKKNLNALWREVPIRASLGSLLAGWREIDMAQNINHVINFKGQPVMSIKNAWKATLRRAGIARRIRPYDLRHAFATELIATGADIGTVAKLMGHSSPVMLLNHYQYVMDTQKRNAVEHLPEIPYVPKQCAQKNMAVTKI